MTMRQLSRSGFNRGSQRCRGATQRQVLAGVGLSVFVLLGVWWIIANLQGNTTGPDEILLHYECAECEKHFTLSNNELAKQTPASEQDSTFFAEHPERTPDQAHCPHCGEKHAGLLMTECPACGEHFLRAKVNLRTQGPDYEAPPPICPHCGVNVDEYFAEK